MIHTSLRPQRPRFNISTVLSSEYRQSHPRRSAELQGFSRELLFQCPTPLSVTSTRGKSESLESLIRADNATNSFRILEEDDIVVPTCPKLKPTNVLMQLITCGSLSVKENENVGIVQAYKPRFPNLKFPSPLIFRTMMMGELDYLSENPRLMGTRLEEKEYFSGSLVETKMQRDVPAERYSALKRSSSYNEERSGETLDCARPDEDTTDTSRSRCLPRTPILSSFLHPKSDTLTSPVSDCRRSSSARQDSDLASGDGSRRFIDAASARADSSTELNSTICQCWVCTRCFSFGRTMEARRWSDLGIEGSVLNRSCRLSSGARVVIHCTLPCNDSDEGSER